MIERSSERKSGQQEGQPAPATRSASQMTQPQPAVLLVDDTSANLLALKALLSDVGCELVCASSGNEALRQLLRREFAVMLLDVQMPDMDGYEVARYVRQNPVTRDVPIIFVTAMDASEENILRGYDSGAVDYLFKPINPSVLRSKVRIFLDLYLSRNRLADQVRAHKQTLAELEAFNFIDLHPMLQRIAGLMVPHLADWCVIALGSGGATADPAMVLATGTGKQALLEQLVRRCSFPAHQPRAFPGGAWDGKPELHERVVLEQLANGARDETELAMLKELGIGSAIVVPLPARESNLGAITVVFGASGRRYTRSDLELIEELGRRTALSIDNARLYQEAQNAIRMRDEFLSVASHELKTPLTALQLQQQMALRAIRERETSNHAQMVEDRLVVALKQTGRLKHLIDSLLDVSRIAAGHLKLNLEELDFAGVVLEILRSFADALRVAGCELVTSLAPGIYGQWDRVRIEQIVTNLLSNAIKFGSGKPIAVSTEQKDGSVLLRVSDQGIGIAATDHDRIFDRFERAVSARNYGGLGLGLYISRRIALAHGGALSVASELGQGAIFSVELPLEPPTASSGSGEGRPSTGG